MASTGGGAEGQAGAQTEDDSTVTEVLQRQANVDHLKFVVGLYALIGTGFGLTAFLADNQLGGGTSQQFIAGFIIILAVGVPLVIGPVVAALTGLRIGGDVDGSGNAPYLVTVVANGAGYVAMVVVNLVLVIALLSDGGGSGSGGSDISLGDYVLPVVLIGVVVGLVGAGAVFVERWAYGTEDR